VEQNFYRELVGGFGLKLAELPDRDDTSCWSQLRAILAEAFVTKARDEWIRTIDGSDACISPVLTMSEALESTAGVPTRVRTL
jgi:alpha-methylacyl-CoA racemase